MSAKDSTENENFIDVLLALGFSIPSIGLILNNLKGNQALIRLVGQGTNFTLSAVQSTALTNAFLNAGLSATLARDAVESIQMVPLKNQVTDKGIETQTESGFTNALIAGGLSLFLATAVTDAVSNDVEVIKLIKERKRPVIFTTKKDNKVDDLICLPLDDEVFAIDDPLRPKIPGETHKNCRCVYIDAVTGENLGQF